MSVIITPLAAGERESRDFRMTVNGKPLPVAQVRVSAMPLNRWWPGHQRPIEQTEIASYASFDFSEPVQITVESISRTVETLEIRPREMHIKPKIAGNTISFVLDRPRHFTVEVNGFCKALHVFSNPIEDYGVDIHDRNTIYFGPGVHRADLIVPQSNQTVYLDAGAVVKGAILVYRADNVKIVGRGVLDTGDYVRLPEYQKGAPGSRIIDQARKLGKGKGLAGKIGNITAIGSKNLLIDGIILRDPPMWSMNIRDSCENVTLNNLKLIGLWRYNSDGIDICVSDHVRISGCFIRSFDDSIVTRGTCSDDEKNDFFDMVTTDCVLWCEWGRAIEIWTSRHQSLISNIVYKDCHIIHAAHVALDLQVYSGGPTRMEDILFENITLDCDFPSESPVYQNHDLQVYENKNINHVPGLFHAELCYGYDAPVNRLGLPCDVTFKNITVRNIRVTGRNQPMSIIKTKEPYVKAENILFEDIYFNGKKAASAAEMNLSVSDTAKNIKII